MILGLWGYEKIDPEGRPIYPLIAGQIGKDQFAPCNIVGPFLIVDQQDDDRVSWVDKLTCDQICSVKNRMNGYTNEDIQNILDKYINKNNDEIED